ncbi:MAG: Ig-like domain-containing protein, partial [Bacilli bacterium]
MKNKKVILTLASLAVLLSGCKNTTSSSTSGQNSGYVAVTDLSVDNTSVTIGVNMTKTLTATVSPVNATDKDVTFSSVDSSIAAVSSSGILTGISEGKTLIVVTAGGKTKTVSVTVTSSPNQIGYAEKTGTFKAAWSVGSSMFMLTNNTFYSPLTFQYQTRDNVLDLKDPHVFLSSSMDGVKNGTVSVAEQTYKNYEAMVNATSFTDILDGTLKSFVGGLVNRKGLLPG